MKKIVLFFLFLSLFSLTHLFCYTNVNSSTANALNIGIDIPEVQLIEREYRDGNTYSSLVLPNTGKLMTGKPDVPGLANWILIPNGTNVSISTYPGTPLIFENVDLAPLQPEPSDNVDIPLPPFEKDISVFSRNAEYPGTFAEVESTKRKRGQECTILWIYPYQYNPVERTLTVYPDLEVSVNFNGIIKPIPANLVNDRLIESLKSFAINAEEVLQAEESVKKVKANESNRVAGCELLIITDNSYLSAAVTLAEWKTKRGILTTVVPTTTTGSTVSSIENYINNAYDNWDPAPSYFLFIGDDEDIPAQDVTSTPSDFYYADRQNPPDWVADFGYGRLSVDTSTQADNLVARIISYERSPSTNSSYYTDILNAACFQDGELPSEAPDRIANRRFCKTSEDVRNYLHDIQGYPWSQQEYVAYNRVGSAQIYPKWWNDTSQTFQFIFENDNPPSGGVEIPLAMQYTSFWDGSTTGISSAFNNGVFFALFRAHGGISGWGDPDFSSTNVDALTNGEDRPIVWSITCQSGWFDGTECFAEHWIRHNTGGSCGVLAATRNSYSGPNDRFIWGMMNAIWPSFDSYCSFSYGSSTPIYRMGDVKNYGMNYMATHYSVADRQETIRLFHWFGDPTMEMWTSQPSQLTNAYTTSNVNIGTSSMNVYVEPAVSGMLVCAYNENDDVFSTATTNTSGYAYLTFNNPLTTESYVEVTVTKNNYLPYEFNAGTNTWDGSLNRFWSQPANWSLNHVPLAGENVIIPDVALTDPMYIDYEDAVCNDLTIASGVELQVEDQTLTVNGDLIVSGHINMMEVNATINVMGTVDWYSGSELTTTVNNVFLNVYGGCYFRAGANVNPTQGYIDFKGSGDSWIRSYDSSCSFYRLRNYKYGGGRVIFSNLSTQDVVIENLIYTSSSSILESMSSHAIIIRGNFNYYGTFDFTQLSNTGSVVFDGTTQQIHKYSTNSGIFNNVVFSASSSVTLVDDDITVMGDLTIEQGVFNPADYTVTVGGDWTNSVGAAGFTEGTGSVIFDGANSAALLSPETFYDLQVDKTYIGFAGLETGFGNDNGVDVTVLHNLNIFDGTMELNNPTNLVIGNNIYITAGATINANDSGIINISVVEDWFDYNTSGGFDAGSYSVVTFNGTTLGALHQVSEASYFNDLVIDSNASYLRPSSPEGTTLYCRYMDIIQGKLKVSGYSVIVDEQLTISGSVEMATSGGSLFVGNITWEAGSSCLIGDGVVNVSGNWNNSGSPITTGISLVEFDSSGDPQDVFGTNTFYDVHQINNGEYLRFYGTTTILNELDLDYFCWAYNDFQVDGTLNINDAVSRFTANGTSANATIATLDQGGTIFCNAEATITINDLVETRIMGTYYSNNVGCTINLSNGGSAVDLNADLYIYGGTMNIAGSVCWWPYGGDASITMTDGVIDVTDCGIYLASSNTLTETITGGTIRTAYGFTGVRDYFNPTGGTIELYGTATGNLSMGAESNFYDVLINKAAADNTIDKVIKPSKSERTTMVDRDGSVVELTRSEIVLALSELDINGNFTIDSGIFNTNGWDMNVGGDWANNAGITGFNEGTRTVTFDGANDADILTSETFYNLIVDKTYGNFDGLEIYTGNSIHILNDLTISDGTLEMNDNSILNVEHDVQIDLNAGLNAGILDTGINLYIGGNWTNDNIVYTPAGIVGYTPGGETITFYGSTDQIITTAAPQEDFGNLVIDKSGGEFRSNDNIRVMHDLDIIAGGWHDNASSLTHYCEGDFFVTAGAAAWWNSLTNNTVVFKGTADQTVYNPYGYHYFRNIMVDKTAWPTRSFENHEGAETQQSRVNNINLNDETRALTVTLTSSIDMEFGDGLTIEEGTLDLNGNNLYTMGDVNINSGGTIIVDEGAQLQIGGDDELNVYNGGTLEVFGSSGNLATVTHRSTGNYDFNIFTGGTISAEYGLFEYMMWNGVYVWQGAFVDPVHSFNYCTFQNGYVDSGPLLYINNFDDITITGAHFPDASSSDYNVAKITAPPAGQGYITMVNATGIFSGETYEYDPNIRIDWTMGLPEIDDLTIQYNSGTNRIELVWTYPVPVDQFKVYRSTDPHDFTGATIFTTATVGYSEPASGTKYFYRVTAENISDNVVSRKEPISSETAPWSK